MCAVDDFLVLIKSKLNFNMISACILRNLLWSSVVGELLFWAPHRSGRAKLAASQRVSSHSLAIQIASDSDALTAPDGSVPRRAHYFVVTPERPRYQKVNRRIVNHFVRTNIYFTCSSNSPNQKNHWASPSGQKSVWRNLVFGSDDSALDFGQATRNQRVMLRNNLKACEG